MPRISKSGYRKLSPSDRKKVRSMVNKSKSKRRTYKRRW